MQHLPIFLRQGNLLGAPWVHIRRLLKHTGLIKTQCHTILRGCQKQQRPSTSPSNHVIAVRCFRWTQVDHGLGNIFHQIDLSCKGFCDEAWAIILHHYQLGPGWKPLVRCVQSTDTACRKFQTSEQTPFRRTCNMCNCFPTINKLSMLSGNL